MATQSKPAEAETTEAVVADYADLVGEGRAERYEVIDQHGDVWTVTRNIDTGKHVTAKQPKAEGGAK